MRGTSRAQRARCGHFAQVAPNETVGGSATRAGQSARLSELHFGMNATGKLLRLGAAIALAIGGLVHLQLYFQGYRHIDKIGPSFLLNAIASAVVAAAVATRAEWFVRAAGIAVAAGTIVAFFLSRVGDGLFDFREEGFQPSPQAAIAFIVEVAAIGLLAATFVKSIAAGDESAPLRQLGIATGAAAVVFVVLGVVWSSRYDTGTDVAITPTTIVIRDFTFKEDNVTVDVGSTVTWSNTDPIAHSVVADDGSFSSGDIGVGDIFDHTFDEAGTFPYICGIHESMAGTVTVTG